MEAYKIGDDFPGKPASNFADKKSTVCNEYFGSDSKLQRFFHLLDPENYKTACETNMPDADYTSVAAYVTALNSNGFQAKIPKKFGNQPKKKKKMFRSGSLCFCFV